MMEGDGGVWETHGREWGAQGCVSQSRFDSGPSPYLKDEDAMCDDNWLQRAAESHAAHLAATHLRKEARWMYDCSVGNKKKHPELAKAQASIARRLYESAKACDEEGDMPQYTEWDR